MIPYIIQGNNISLVIDNKSYSISKSHIGFDRIRTAIKDQNWDLVRELVNPKEQIINYGNGFISIKNGAVFWNNIEMHNALTIRMLDMLNEGFSIEPLANFMSNLLQNPSFRAVQELYGFLENNNLPITPDGHFLAYKKVRNDFFDIHSNTIDNSIGKVVSMERNMVNDNKEQTCSTGLHFCSIEYLKSFGDATSRTVIVKINPRDVVSIPVDYNNSKGRTCQYTVIGELNGDPENAFIKPVQETANENADLTRSETNQPWFNWPKPKY